MLNEITGFQNFSLSTLKLLALNPLIMNLDYIREYRYPRKALIISLLKPTLEDIFKNISQYNKKYKCTFFSNVDLATELLFFKILYYKNFICSIRL